MSSQKSYKSLTANKGTTIILEDGLAQATLLTETWLNNQSEYDGPFNWKYGWNKQKYIDQLNEAKEQIHNGNPVFSKKVQDKIDQYLGIIDDIYPIFSLNKQGYKRSSDEGIHCSPELLAAGEEQCIFQSKHSTEKHFLKTPSGEGAYRILINTDVSWWGQPDDNCALVACIILLLQRYAPVEIWIQQGWLGNNQKDGVTLFKLDYSAGLDLSNLAFWICSPLKDDVYSFLLNKALGRYNTNTSTVAEIECDLMLRGDWFLHEGLEEQKITKMMATERADIIATWIAKTSYKIVYGMHSDQSKQWTDIFGNPEPPTITE